MAKDDLSFNLMMDKEQALGYMLLSCKKMGLSMEQVEQIHSNMISHFNQCSPEEAKKEGEEWFSSIQEKVINSSKSSGIENQMPITLFKRANVGIPKITESNSSRKLREKNERIIAELQRMEDGPFGILRLFRRHRR